MKNFFGFAQVSASTAAKTEAEALLFNIGGVEQLTRGVVELMIKVVRKTPWGEKLEASETIIRWIQDREGNKKMKWHEVVDVACAINVFLPSPAQLASGLTKTKRGIADLKRSIASIDVKDLRTLAIRAK